LDILVVQWFSGMLFCCAGSALYNTKPGGEFNRDRKVGVGRFGLEIGIKGGKVSRD
jgi:hypothetical protein